MPRDMTAQSGFKIEDLKSLLGADYTPEIAEAFPDIMPRVYPCGANLLVQLRTETNYITLANGAKFYKPDDSTTADQARTQTGLVRAIGPACFRNRNTLDAWPEGDWCGIGWFIRTPMYGGDRHFVPVKASEPNGPKAIFLTIRDTDCLAVMIGNPLGLEAG